MSCNDDGVIETNDPDRPWINCQMCAELEAETERLKHKCNELIGEYREAKAENAKLKDENAGLLAAVESLGADNEALLGISDE